MTKQEIIDAFTALAASLDAIKESATNREFFAATRPDMRLVHRALVALRDTPDE